MKRFLAMVMICMMVISSSTVAFADTGSFYQEKDNYKANFNTWLGAYNIVELTENNVSNIYNYYEEMENYLVNEDVIIIIKRNGRYKYKRKSFKTFNKLISKNPKLISDFNQVFIEENRNKNFYNKDGVYRTWDQMEKYFNDHVYYKYYYNNTYYNEGEFRDIFNNQIAETSYNITYYVNGDEYVQDGSFYSESRGFTNTQLNDTEVMKELVSSPSDLNLPSLGQAAYRFEEVYLSNQPIVINNYNKTIKVYYTNVKVLAEISNWKRSDIGRSGVIKLTNALTWTWSDVANLKCVVKNNVWDNGDYFSTYSNKFNTGFAYATWRLYNGIDIRRFQNELKIPEGFSGNDLIRMRTVNQKSYRELGAGGIIPINDNIFVFMYPKDVVISNDNYLDYLALWTGTSNQSGVIEFHGFKGTKCTKNQHLSRSTLRVTDGWLAEAPIDNIGNCLRDAESGDEYIVDIFVIDYSAGGGMDKPVFELVKNESPTTFDDMYVVAPGETINIDAEHGVLANDKSNNENTIELTVDEKRNTYVYDDENNKIGLLNLYSDGSFSFTAENDYYGQAEFEYICNDVRTHSKGKATFNVLSKIEVEHFYPNTRNQSEKTVVQNIFFLPNQMTWKDTWIWPSKIDNSEVDKISNETSKNKCLIETLYNEGYKYSKLCEIENGREKEVETDVIGTYETINPNFNTRYKYYYEELNSTITLKFVNKEGSSDIVLTTIDKKFNYGDSYDIVKLVNNNKIDINGYEFVSYDSNGYALSGIIKDKSFEVIMIYNRSKLEYQVNYYINDVKNNELSYVASDYYGNQVYDYTTMITNKGIDLNKYEIVEIENQNMSISTDLTKNIINIKLESKNKLKLKNIGLNISEGDKYAENKSVVVGFTYKMNLKVETNTSANLICKLKDTNNQVLDESQLVTMKYNDNNDGIDCVFEYKNGNYIIKINNSNEELKTYDLEYLFEFASPLGEIKFEVVGIENGINYEFIDKEVNLNVIPLPIIE